MVSKVTASYIYAIRHVILGEICNFAAYAFAPAILVTPLGALSVLIGAVLGSYFLQEELGIIGKLGCALCLIGAIIIVLHAPPAVEVETIDQILKYALAPGYLIYCLSVAVFATVMMFKIAPVYGKKNPLIYVSICSTVGSVSIMSVKAFGIAVKLTFGGNNQFKHGSTYVFITLTGFCILVQMNYFNKALESFSTQIANLNRNEILGRRSTDTRGTGIISSVQTQLSLSARRSMDPWCSVESRGDEEGLMCGYEEAVGVGLANLIEGSDEEGA
ncbi:hypothetical protein TruAng_000945 [Truncatella angustata]|nr:hypothetical protein TruAng_000945 [Truncatella angustata]